jgi:hypothetical protein
VKTNTTTNDSDARGTHIDLIFSHELRSLDCSLIIKQMERMHAPTIKVSHVDSRCISVKSAHLNCVLNKARDERHMYFDSCRTEMSLLNLNVQKKKREYRSSCNCSVYHKQGMMKNVLRGS